MEYENLKLYYKYSLNDNKNNLIEQTPRIRCHSWLRQFLQVAHNVACTQTHSITTTARYDPSYLVYTGGVNNLNTAGPANNDYYGIIVGTDDTAVTFDDYKLGAQILQGAGAGLFQYGAMTYGAPATDGGETSFSLTRVFTNNSGSSIDVKEIGVAAYQTTNYYVLLIRDVITPITVGIGDILTLNYIITTEI